MCLHMGCTQEPPIALDNGAWWPWRTSNLVGHVCLFFKVTCSLRFQEKLDLYSATRQMIPRFLGGSKFLRSKSVRLPDFWIQFLITEALWSSIVGAMATQWHSQYGSGMWAHLCWCRCGGWVAVEKPMTVMNELKFLWHEVFSVWPPHGFRKFYFSSTIRTLFSRFKVQDSVLWFTPARKRPSNPWQVACKTSWRTRNPCDSVLASCCDNGQLLSVATFLSN